MNGRFIFFAFPRFHKKLFFSCSNFFIDTIPQQCYNENTIILEGGAVIDLTQLPDDGTVSFYNSGNVYYEHAYFKNEEAEIVILLLKQEKYNL